MSSKKVDQSIAETRSLFDEISDVLFSSVCVYGITWLREYISKNGVNDLKGDPVVLQKLTDLPITRLEFLDVFLKNLGMLGGLMKTETYLKALESLGKEHNLLLEEEKKKEEQEKKAVLSKQTRVSIYQHIVQQEMKEDVPMTIEVIGDEKKELAYCIYIDRSRKEIKLVFRGSVTAEDWSIDFNAIIKQLPNPLYEDIKKGSTTAIPQGKKVGVHLGFYNYMFKKPNKEEVGKSKFETIQEHLDRFQEAYPDFTLTVTGHSMGAALATLFSYIKVVEERNSSNNNQKPIKCFVIASPRVGNENFARAFQELDHRGNIQFLRVAHNRDIVTQFPERSWLPSSDANIYKHAGTELKLYPTKGYYKVFSGKTYSKNKYRDFCHKSLQAVRYCIPYPAPVIRLMVGGSIKWHVCDSYLDTLDKNREKLEKTSLSDVLGK